MPSPSHAGPLVPPCERGRRPRRWLRETGGPTGPTRHRRRMRRNAVVEDWDEPTGQRHGSRLGDLVRAIEHPEVERTCAKCGATWEVPGHYTRADSAIARRFTPALRSTRGARVGSGVYRLPAGTPAEMKQFEETVRQYKTCPGCGSYDQYDQRHLLRESRQQDILESEDNE